jgi:hypothetical protein
MVRRGARARAANHINAVGKENLELRVVMHGHGIAMVLQPAHVGPFLQRAYR